MLLAIDGSGPPHTRTPIRPLKGPRNATLAVASADARCCASSSASDGKRKARSSRVDAATSRSTLAMLLFNGRSRDSQHFIAQRDGGEGFVDEARPLLAQRRD